MASKSRGATMLGCLMVALSCLVMPSFPAHAGDLGADGAATKELYFKVYFRVPIKGSALKPGDTVEGELSDAVFSGVREVFPAGSRVRLTVERLERKRRAASDRWPWVIRAFAPRHENHPVFSAASVFLPDGREVPLRVSLISISDKKDVRVQFKAQKAVRSPKGSKPPTDGEAAASQPSSASNKSASQKAYTVAATATFEAVELTGSDRAATVEPGPGAQMLNPAGIEAGTQARVILLGEVRASKSHPGDVVAARLVEPIRRGSTVILPEGSVFEGTVVKVKRPKSLSRSGSILLTFDRVILPDGVSAALAASIVGAELDAESRTTIDPEGNLNGGRPGKAWMLINLGASIGIAKAADDAFELAAGLIVATATEASTAGTARIVGACVSGVFLLTRHGRDVVLPRLTEMRIVLDHAVSLPSRR